MVGAREQRGDVRTLKLSVALYIVIFALKLGAYLVTGVMALLAEAFHTLSDIFIYAFLLVAAVWSRKEADQVHMFGYGRAQNVAALVAATLFISFTSYKLYEEAIPRLFSSSEATFQALPVAIGVIGVSMVIVAAPLVGVVRQRRRGAAAKAQLVALLNDELGLLAALVGTLFVLADVPVADPVASLVVATVIAASGVGLLRDNASFLLGRAPGPEFMALVERLARSVDGVLDVRDLRAEFIGPDTVHVGMHIVVKRSLPIEEADRIAEEVRSRVHETTGAGYCVIHVDASEAVRPVTPGVDLTGMTG